MRNPSGFCTCNHLDCPLHPTRHDMGCAPCISKNLSLNEIPNCFFSKVRGAETRSGDTFQDFAEAVLKQK